ncbi:zinc-binding metallopeptidase family protein [Histidinibacterium lentulum]|uniref:Zinc-ribbon domain-containing protein n=1 Tax=Histidinibacterium lentulum TaxID=2480588 RepID=A0A3N2QLP2_9RHOB|nr:putative zinc-binding metallopeptidase [Histidinibacterium lentulum]ROT96128.1 hypothetical protein EAT49_19300 [Histidinibacterium lentulum]
MQVFTCPACGGTVYFRNLVCTCGAPLWFDPEAQRMVPEGDTAWDCANRAAIGCNWRAEEGVDLCSACAMTELTPDLRAAGNLPLWAETEAAKRWVLAGLARWGWFVRDDPGPRPVFRLMSEVTAGGVGAEVTMGHADGVVTLNVTEAGEAERARRQEELGELYRTMTGHVRHEIAHVLFLRLLEREGFAAAFRERFGDERADYGAALARHYADPRPADDSHVTPYATAHPHEDWAETVSHLLHLVDLTDSGVAAGLGWPGGPGRGYDAYGEHDAERLIGHALELALAANHVNRAMDLPDLYPFVLPPGVRQKMAFAHGWLVPGT